MNKGSGIKSVLNNSVVYTISGLLMKCFSFFLLPLYTRCLTTEDYGITSVSSSFIQTGVFIVALSLFAAVTRFYVDLKDDYEKLKRFYGTIICFVLVTSSIASIMLIVFRRLLVKYVFTGISFFPCILITIITLGFECQHTIYINILKSQQQATKCAIVTFIYFLVSVALNIVFVVRLDLGVVGVLLASLISAVLLFIYAIWDLKISDLIMFCIDVPLLKSALKYSIPIIPHNLSTYLATLISKVLIGGEMSLGAVGLYSIASQFGAIADVVQNYSDSAYSPWLYEQLKERKTGYKDNINNVSKILTTVLGLFMIGIALFAQDYIVLFLDKSYVEAWKLVPFIVGVYIIKIFYYFYVAVLFYNKKASQKLFIATLMGSLINIFLSYIFIPLWGSYGSVFADAVAMIIRVTIVVVMSVQIEHIGLQLRDFLQRAIYIVVFIMVGLFFSYTKFQYEFSIFNLLYKCMIVFLYVAVFIFVPYRREISHFLNKKGERNKQ